MLATNNSPSCIILDKDVNSLKNLSVTLGQYSFVNVTSVFTNIMDTIVFLSQHQPVFLVISHSILFENDNFRIINKVFPESRVIVIGKNDDDFITTFILGKYNFLQEPFEKSQMLEIVKNIYQDYLSGENVSSDDKELNELDRNGLFVKGDSGYVRVSFDEIDYIKAFGEYAKLYKNKKWTLLSCTLKKITEQLPKLTFARVHRSFTVRIGSIRSFDAHEIKIGDDYVPIGRNYKKDFESSLLRLV